MALLGIFSSIPTEGFCFFNVFLCVALLISDRETYCYYNIIIIAIPFLQQMSKASLTEDCEMWFHYLDKPFKGTLRFGYTYTVSKEHLLQESTDTDMQLIKKTNICKQITIKHKPEVERTRKCLIYF